MQYTVGGGGVLSPDMIRIVKYRKTGDFHLIYTVWSLNDGLSENRPETQFSRFSADFLIYYYFIFFENFMANSHKKS